MMVLVFEGLVLMFVLVLVCEVFMLFEVLGTLRPPLGNRRRSVLERFGGQNGPQVGSKIEQKSNKKPIKKPTPIFIGLGDDF